MNCAELVFFLLLVIRYTNLTQFNGGSNDLITFGSNHSDIGTVDNLLLKLLVYFLCRLGSIAAHKDHFVWRLSVCSSICFTLLQMYQLTSVTMHV